MKKTEKKTGHVPVKKRGDFISTRQRLVLAGIEEMNQYGIRSFSVRRIAQKCGVSCAAPYKHFKNKQAFYAAIIEHILELWHQRQVHLLEKKAGTLREKLVAISLEYIHFLVENPQFRSVLMLKDEQLDSETVKMKRFISPRTAELLQQYCRDVKMPEETVLKKTYIVRSLMYGASLMFDNGELAYTPEILELVRETIDREFDLP